MARWLSSVRRAGWAAAAHCSQEGAGPPLPGRCCWLWPRIRHCRCLRAFTVLVIAGCRAVPWLRTLTGRPCSRMCATHWPGPCCWGGRPSCGMCVGVCQQQLAHLQPEQPEHRLHVSGPRQAPRCRSPAHQAPAPLSSPQACFGRPLPQVAGRSPGPAAPAPAPCRPAGGTAAAAAPSAPPPGPPTAPASPARAAAVGRPQQRRLKGRGGPRPGRVQPQPGGMPR